MILSKEKSILDNARLYKIGKYKTYYIAWEERNRSRRRSLKTKDYSEAVSRFEIAKEAIINEYKMKGISNIVGYPKPDPITIKHWKESIDKLNSEPKSWLNCMFNNAKHKARKKNIEFSITHDDFVNLIVKTNGLCSVTGIPFVLNTGDESRVHPYKPSLDRKNSYLGYSEDNCRITCYCVNLAMNQWGEDVLETMALSYVSNKYKVNDINYG